jgi:long-chain acyl-CoA synthetase
MSAYTDRPWLALYPAGSPTDIEVEHDTALAMFENAVRRSPDAALLQYFDATLTVRQVDELTDALAAGLQRRGFAAGDRLAVYLQNIPQFVLAMLATWKAGGIMVSINPMNRQRELLELLTDSGATALVCQEDLYRDVAAEVLPKTSVRIALTTSPLDFIADPDPRVFGAVVRQRIEGVEDLLEVAEENRGERPEPAQLAADDVAFLVYTSGTTGPPKGAMNTHRNVVFNAQVYRDWMRLTDEDVILGVAPLFHITGLIADIALSFLLPAPLVLAYRFDPTVTLEQVEQKRASFTVASITVFIALMNAPGARGEQLASLATIYSGGAPIPPSTVEAFQAFSGHYIHNVYGLTETTSPSHAVPLGGTAPVDPASGALSVGVPVFNTIVRVVGEDESELPPGEVGEIMTEGPQVVAGYWHKPEETEKALGGARLRTGDVGYMDSDGWFYIVDRRKDQINAAGYKVWPREVEDVLYEHPAVREAAVVGVPDEYRGETVKAFVSLRPGQRVEPGELVAFCKSRMAAYKYPRQVEILEELPKTVTGKILRRELRDEPKVEA